MLGSKEQHQELAGLSQEKAKSVVAKARRKSQEQAKSAKLVRTSKGKLALHSRA